MFTNILLPVDGSGASFSAARKGIALATTLKSRVAALVITVPWATYFARELAVVVPDVVVPQSEYDRKSANLAASILQSVEEEARQVGVNLTAVHRSHQSPHSAIVEEAAKQGCDLIVMASHHQPGFTGAFLGSETMAVLGRTNIPVLVYRQH
jgi:nucleotide-binding universal stress UspA family protein